MQELARDKHNAQIAVIPAAGQMNPEISAKEHLASSERDARSSLPRTARLRVGIMIDDWFERAWVARIIEEIQRGESARVVTVIVNRMQRVPRWKRVGRLWRVLLYLLYCRLDRWIMRRLFKIRHDAFDRVDLHPLLKDAAVLEVVPQCNKYSDRFDEATLAQVRDQRLDVILRFGFRILRGPILESARWGIWSFHHGDNREYRGVPPMFWEMFEGNPVCGVTLQILTDVLDGGKVICRTFERTNPYSLYLNQNRSYWKAIAGLVTRLRQLHGHGWQALSQLDTYQDQTEYSKPIYRLPGNLTMLRFLARIFGRFVRRAVTELFTDERWFVAWRPRPDGGTIVPPNAGEPYRVFQPPSGFSYADPFPLEYQGRHYLFFEHYQNNVKHGVISWVEIDSQGNPSTPRMALRADYHLSYPCVFEHQGQVFMIPETRTRRRIELWRADHFPDRWTFDRVLIDDISAVDATWFKYGERFWLFAGVTLDGSSSSEQLHVYSSAKPFGPWQPHPDNPVFSSIRGARPAGRPFLCGGQLIRPGQDGAKVYGHQVRLYRIDRLTDTEYHETEIALIQPDWLSGNIGTHTYNLDGKFEVIDGRLRVLRRLWPRRDELRDS